MLRNPSQAQAAAKRWSDLVGHMLLPGNDISPPNPPKSFCMQCGTTCLGTDLQAKSRLEQAIDVLSMIVAPRGVGMSHKQKVVAISLGERPLAIALSLSCRKSPYFVGEFLLCEADADCDFQPPFELKFQQVPTPGLPDLPHILTESDFLRTATDVAIGQAIRYQVFNYGLRGLSTLVVESVENVDVDGLLARLADMRKVERAMQMCRQSHKKQKTKPKRSSRPAGKGRGGKGARGGRGRAAARGRAGGLAEDDGGGVVEPPACDGSEHGDGEAGSDVSAECVGGDDLLDTLIGGERRHADFWSVY